MNANLHNRPEPDDHATSTAGTDRLLVDWSALATRSGTSGPSHIADILRHPAILAMLQKTGGVRTMTATNKGLAA